MQTLFLRLAGPLQSWGVRSHWSIRDTLHEPTKSGVIGLLGCALGLRRDDAHLRVLSDGFQMGVRVDKPGSLLRDYHTTGGAKAADGKPEGMWSAEGKRKRETDVSERSYLADASFLVALQGPAHLVDAAANALQSPVWPVFLGRKSCPPAVPVFAGTSDYNDIWSALTDTSHTWRQVEPGADYPLRLLLEVGPGQGNPQNDAIGNPARRVFLPRFVAEHRWKPGDNHPSINTFE